MGVTVGCMDDGWGGDDIRPRAIYGKGEGWEDCADKPMTIYRTGGSKVALLRSCLAREHVAVPVSRCYLSIYLTIYLSLSLLYIYVYTYIDLTQIESL
jgi:hypothetical protein